MSASAEPFLDTNVLLYLLSGDTGKADRAEACVAAGGAVSVQVLNEFVSVATRKLGLSLGEAIEVLDAVRAHCRVVPLDEPCHDLAVRWMDRYGLPIYDATIAAAAALSGCRTILTEDMQDGMRFEGGARVRNPFA